MTDKLLALIEKLNNKNYHYWAIRMKAFLTKEDCWDSIVKECPADATEKTAWELKDVKAQQYIVLCIGNDQLVLVNETKTAKEAWQKLRSYYLKSTLTVKVRLLRRVCKTELARGGDMAKHLLEMTEAMSELKECGYKLDDDIATFLLLSSVNEEEYGGLITALEARDEKSITYDVIRNKLLEEFEKHKQQSNVEKLTAYNSQKMRKFGKKQSRKECFFCKRDGHFQRDCVLHKEWLKKQDASGRNNFRANSVKTPDEVRHAYTSLRINSE